MKAFLTSIFSLYMCGVLSASWPLFTNSAPALYHQPAPPAFHQPAPMAYHQSNPADGFLTLDDIAEAMIIVPEDKRTEIRQALVQIGQNLAPGSKVHRFISSIPIAVQNKLAQVTSHYGLMSGAGPLPPFMFPSSPVPSQPSLVEALTAGSPFHRHAYGNHHYLHKPVPSHGMNIILTSETHTYKSPSKKYKKHHKTKPADEGENEGEDDIFSILSDLLSKGEEGDVSTNKEEKIDIDAGSNEANKTNIENGKSAEVENDGPSEEQLQNESQAGDEKDAESNGINKTDIENGKPAEIESDGSSEEQSQTESPAGEQKETPDTTSEDLKSSDSDDVAAKAASENSLDEEASQVVPKDESTQPKDESTDLLEQASEISSNEQSPKLDENALKITEDIQSTNSEEKVEPSRSEALTESLEVPKDSDLANLPLASEIPQPQPDETANSLPSEGSQEQPQKTTSLETQVSDTLTLPVAPQSENIETSVSSENNQNVQSVGSNPNSPKVKRRNSKPRGSQARKTKVANGASGTPSQSPPRRSATKRNDSIKSTDSSPLDETR